MLLVLVQLLGEAPGVLGALDGVQHGCRDLAVGVGGWVCGVRRQAPTACQVCVDLRVVHRMQLAVVPLDHKLFEKLVRLFGWQVCKIQIPVNVAAAAW